jgi:hypothetical protein
MNIENDSSTDSCVRQVSLADHQKKIGFFGSVINTLNSGCCDALGKASGKE